LIGLLRGGAGVDSAKYLGAAVEYGVATADTFSGTMNATYTPNGPALIGGTWNLTGQHAAHV
jgi:hypothetical protein